MSIVKIQGNASGTGTFTIASPNSNTDVTINLPTVTGGDFVVSNSSGNVGIGVTPSAWVSTSRALQVGGYGAFYEASGGDTNATSNTYLSAGNIYRSIVGIGASRYQLDFGAHRWYTAAAVSAGSVQTFNPTMVLDANGNLLLNTTSNPGTAAKFVVSGNSDGTYNPMTVVQEAAGSTSRTSIQFYRNSASAVVGTITTTNAATAYVTSSDYRLKHDIQPMAGALAKVAALKPVTYKWKIDDSQSQGFIAHELQAVVPEAVVGEKDAVDAEGKPQYQGIDTSFLVATLTAAIQELKAINDAQATTITALTARVAALEGQA